ncbi:MAG: HNH endonuclease [Cyclobacteriaceae bacterium]
MNCIFCKQNASNSKSVEHVIPESLGSKKLVLPKGIVCDKCNNYFARKIEKPLLDHDSFRNIRAWYQVPTKKGKYPSVKGEIRGTGVEINIKRNSENKLDINSEKQKDKSEVSSFDISKNPLIFKLEIDPPKKLMSRFMAKMALEFVAFRGHKDKSSFEKTITDPYFDYLREYARYGMITKNWPISSRVVFPIETQMRHPETNEWVHAGFGYDTFMNSKRETYFCFLLYGVEFVINMGGPSVKGYELWLEENNHISPMVERVGARLATKTINGKEKHFLEGDFKV